MTFFLSSSFIVVNLWVSYSFGAEGGSDLSFRFTVGNSDFYESVRDGLVITELHNFLGDFHSKFLAKILNFVEVRFGCES